MRRNLSNDYVVGLVDGEGSFTVYIKNPLHRKKLERRVKAEPRFYIKLIEKDKDVLYDLEKIIIPFFKQNKLRFASKLHDFALFCDLMERIKTGDHLTDIGLNEMF